MINWELVMVAVVSVVGFIEYIKGFFPKAPKWVWRVSQLVSSFVMSATASLLPRWVLGGFLILALSQTSYQVILESLKNRFMPKEEKADE